MLGESTEQMSLLGEILMKAKIVRANNTRGLTRDGPLDNGRGMNVNEASC